MNRHSGLQRIDSQPSASFVTSNRNVSNRESEVQQQQNYYNHYGQEQQEGAFQQQQNQFNINNNNRSAQQSFNTAQQFQQQYQQQQQFQQDDKQFQNQPERKQSTRNSLYGQQQDALFQRFYTPANGDQQGGQQRPGSTRNSQALQFQQGGNNNNYYQNQFGDNNNQNGNQNNTIEVGEQQFQESQTNILQNNRGEEQEALRTQEYVFPQNALINFLRKLYSMLLIQTILILVTVWISYLVPDILSFILQNIWIVWTSLGLVTAITIGCFVFRQAVSTVPLNYILLVVQTLALIVLYVYILDLYNVELAFLILIALAAIYFSLLIYVLTTKTELNFRGATLFVTCSAVMIYQLFLIFTDLSYLSSIFILMGIVIWGYFLVYEYQTKVSDVEFDKRDPVISTVTVFLDVFNLLLKVSELIRQVLIKERS